MRRASRRRSRRARSGATPFAWFADLLGTGLLTPGGARKAILARLGAEANDALDEFLNLALDYESREIALAAGLRGLAAHAHRPKSSATWKWRATKCA